MSDNTLHNNCNSNFVPIQPIEDVSYANGINDMINSINNNFKVLANHNFIKGSPADSIKIEVCDRTIDEENGYGIFEALDKFINDNLNGDVATVGGKFNYIDNYTDVHINVLFNIDTLNNIKKPVSTMPYIFLDGRFWNKDISSIDALSYNGLTDKSCVIIGNTNNNGVLEFTSLNTVFPTMYYDPNIGSLCWRWHGKESGIPVSGPSGKNGENALLRIVKGDDGKVTEIFDRYDYCDVNNISNDIALYDNNSALILTSSSDICIGKIFLEDNILKYECATEQSLNELLSVTNIINTFKNINISNTDPNVLKGLFLPISNTDNVCDAHLFTSSAITNTGDDKIDVRHDIIIAPVNDIDNIKATDTDESSNKKLQVNKYLYLTVNDKLNFIQLNNGTNNGKDEVLYSLVENNYSIKYLLNGVITNHNFLNTITKEDNFITTVDDEIQINDDLSNVKYITKTTQNDEIIETETSNNLDTIPQYFQNKTLYRWEAINNSEKPAIPSQFKVIYTTTITPSYDTKYLWFNGCELYKSSKYPNGIVENNGEKSLLFYGWSEMDDNIYAFNRFIPELINDFYTDESDVALNINYNVNIAGNSTDNSKTLTVNGDISANNIISNGTISANEFKNVYCTTPIIADGGMLIGSTAEPNDEGEDVIKYNTMINKDGTIKSSKEVYVPSVKASDYIETKDITSTGTIKTASLNVSAETDNLLTITTNTLVYVEDEPETEEISTYSSNGTTGATDNTIDDNSYSTYSSINTTTSTNTINKQNRFDKLDNSLNLDDFITDKDNNFTDSIFPGTNNGIGTIKPVEMPKLPPSSNPDDGDESGDGDEPTKDYPKLDKKYNWDINGKLVGNLIGNDPQNNVTTKSFTSIDIDLKNTNNINIEGHPVAKYGIEKTDNIFKFSGNTNNIPKIVTNVPMIGKDNCSIVITNETPDDVFVDSNIPNNVDTEFTNNANLFTDVVKANIAKIKNTSTNSNYTELANKVFNDSSNNDKVDKDITKIYYEEKASSSDLVNSKNFKINFANTDYNTIIEKSLCIFTLNKQSLENAEFSKDKPVNIKLPKFKFNIGLDAHCDNGYWPEFIYGYMDIVYDVYYQNAQASTPGLLKSYRQISTTNGKSYKFTNTGKLWNSGPITLGGDTATNNKQKYESRRFKSFTVNPIDYEISTSSSILTDVYDKLSNDSTIYIVVYPIFDLKFESEPNRNGKRKKDVIGEIEITKLYPIGYSTVSGNLNILEDNTYIVPGDKNAIKGYETITDFKVFSELTYPIYQTSANDTLSSTTLCRDGIVIRFGETIFGLGVYTPSTGQPAEPSLILYNKGDKDTKPKYKSISELLS